ncbi:MAG: hypothetical protein ACREJ4_14280, partial [Candidatus Methylomirabilaceae bacterium]
MQKPVEHGCPRRLWNVIRSILRISVATALRDAKAARHAWCRLRRIALIHQRCAPVSASRRRTRIGLVAISGPSEAFLT